MDIGKAFGFVFEDEKWVSKVLIGGLLLFVPIFGQFVVYGYMLKVAQNVAQGNPRPLPEWTDFGDLFIRGLYYIVINIVYFIPLILVYCAYYIVLIGATASGNRGTSSGLTALSAIGGLFACVFGILILVLAIVCSMLSYAGHARYVATNSLSEALKVGEVFKAVRTRPAPWLVLLLVGLLAGIVGGLGIIACGVGVLFTGFYAICIQGHALGQTVASQGLLGNSDYVAPVTPIPPTSYQ